MVNPHFLRRRRTRVSPTLLDRAAGDARVVVSLGPLSVLDRDDLAAELVRLAAISPGSRLAIRRNPWTAHGPWDWDPARLAGDVRAWAECFPGTEHLPIHEKVTLVRRTTPTPDGLRVYVAGDHVITDLSHGVFGGVMVVKLWLYLSVCLSRPTPDWSVTPQHRPRTGWLLLRHLVSHPGAVGELAAAGRHRVPTVSAVRTVAGPARPTTVSGYLNPAGVAALQEWRAEHAPDCSVAVLLMTALTRAFDHVGIALSPVVHVVVDASRYDPRLPRYLGNLAVGLNLPFAAPYDPGALQSELGRAMSSGRPLAAMLAISIGELFALRRPGRVAPPAEPATATLSFSHLLGLDDMPDGNWIGGFDAHQFVAVSDPVGARGIALLTPKMRDRYDISASFDERFHDVTTIQHALDLATTDPVSLLTPRTTLDVGGQS
ncbi:DNA-binding protein [Gordonia sp. CPCC 205515]|uniref:DNA-binding protein n=1 Tax=Gordonia sp. CPCC 205515 TaxID=3140791 RepID=UPI003AF3F78E